MKKVFVSMLACLMLAACGSGFNSVLKTGRTPDPDKAIVVMKVQLDPVMNEDGEPAGKSDDMLPVQIDMTFGDGTNIPAKWDDKQDTAFDFVETGKFFAVEVDADKPIAMRGMSFEVTRKSFWSSTENRYSTTLANPSYSIGKLSKGKAYYIGTINIKLADTSYRETGDEEYDKNEMEYVVPNSITVKDEFSAAKKWFTDGYPKAKSGLIKKEAVPKNSGLNNKFNNLQTTTTYHHY